MNAYRTRWAAAALLALLPPLSRAAEGEAPRGAPLRTRWAEEVSPQNAHPEYPRPTMVRERWQNLNGLWDYAILPESERRPPSRFDGKILVPFPIESALSGVCRALSPRERLWYRRSFSVPEGWAGQKILLHFGAVDWEATVFLDGRELGRHRGGFDGFSFDVTEAVRSGGSHELVVSVWDPTDTGWQLRGKQTLRPEGAAYTACSGIWQTVWLEPVPAAHVESLRIVTDPEASALRVAVRARTPPEPTEVEVAVGEGDTILWKARGLLGAELTPSVRANLAWYKARSIWVETEVSVSVPGATLWSPEDPKLYDLTVRLLAPDGATLDAVRSYAGMRKIAVGKDERGVPRPFLNGRPIVLAGALDQGYWPDGIYTAPTDEALRFDIEAAKRLGLNAIRKHVKVEPERYYYWADRLGLLILQDMPSGAEGDPYTDAPRSPEAASISELERRRLIESRWNHPSIIAWILFNEGWGQYDTLRHARWVKELDPTRLVDEASGFPLHGGGDILDVHGGWPAQDGRRIGIVSETAGFGLAVPGHSWPGDLWTAGTYDPETSRESPSRKPYPLDEASKDWYTRAVADFYRELRRNAERIGSSGGFKVQLYDVETECNGLLSYDREVWKVDPEAIAAAIRGEPPPEATFRWSNPIDFAYSEGQTAVRREIRDPCIVREGDRYYLVFTMWPFRGREEAHLAEPNQGGSPGIALYASRDLARWKFEGWLLKSSELPEDCPYKNRFWAPEIHKIAGKFYLIFTADNWIEKRYNPAGTWGAAGYAFVGVAKKITGPYEPIAYIPGAACDTSLFEDTDGRTYAVIPRRHVDVQEIDLRSLEQGRVELLGEPKRAVACENRDVGIPADPEYLEGPWLEKIGARYYLFYAAIYRDPRHPEWLGYQTGVAVAEHPMGPYRKDDRGRVFMGGHLSVFDGPAGRKWFAYRGESPNAARGLLSIDPLEIDADGRVQTPAPTLGPQAIPLAGKRP